ncbi:hypothetical protein EJ110_NYTH51170 [Nymphaea thermarum]|nr:hypothetical protein EJ110_NYTH51170 [Nymphaea thermarum]
MWRGWARVLPSDRRTGRWRLYAVAGASAGGVIVLANSNALESYLGESGFASACAVRVKSGCSGILRSSRAIFTGLPRRPLRDKFLAARVFIMSVAGHRKKYVLEEDEPTEKRRIYAVWDEDNYIVMSWIMNSVESHIAPTIAYYTKAKNMLSFLRKTYSHTTNVIKILQLEEELCNIRQGDQDLSQYFATLTAAYEHMKALRPPCQHCYASHFETGMVAKFLEDHCWDKHHHLRSSVSSGRGRGRIATGKGPSSSQAAHSNATISMVEFYIDPSISMSYSLKDEYDHVLAHRSTFASANATVIDSVFSVGAPTDDPGMTWMTGLTWVVILDSYNIEHIVIYTKVPATILFLYQQVGRGEWTVTGLDNVLSQHLQHHAF